MTPAEMPAGGAHERFCTGCDWPESKPLPPGALACCPDREYRSHAELVRERHTWRHRTFFEQAFTEEMRAERDALQSALWKIVRADEWHAHAIARAALAALSACPP